MAASSTPRTSSGDAERRRPCSTALAKVNVCSAVSQSPNSLLVGKRAMRDGRGERDRRGELDLARAVVQRGEQRLEDLAGLGGEQRLDECVAPVPAPPLGGERLGQPRERVLQQRDEVDGVAPGVRLLHPLGEGELRRERREHRLGPLPAGGVEGLERLVHEVERVAAVQVAVIGGGREEHVRELRLRRARPHRGHERPLGAFGVAHLDEAAEPAREARGLDLFAGQRLQREARLHSGRVRADVR